MIAMWTFAQDKTPNFDEREKQQEKHIEQGV
jgi:hypothetical protein